MKVLKLLIVTLGLVAMSKNVSAQESTLRNELGLNFSTTMNTGLNYKIGGQRVYGLVQIGVNYNEIGAPIAGLGVGYSYALNDLSALNAELMFGGYLYDNFNEGQTDKFSTLHLLYERKFAEKFKFTAGPTISYIENHTGKGFGSKTLINPIANFDTSAGAGGLVVGVSLGVTYCF